MGKAMGILEFHKIKEQLGRYARTPPGSNIISSLSPLFDIEKIKELQRETSEAVGVIETGKIKLEACSELDSILQRSQKSGLLSPIEIRDMGHFLRSIEVLKRTFLKESDVQDKYPLLWGLVNDLTLFPGIRTRLENSVDVNGQILDNASSHLSFLRRDERRLGEKIRKSMDSYLRNPNYQKYLQESLITIRNNRYVLPVKQEFRSGISGIVHDQSDSGQTLFIEPFPVVELNNSLRGVKGNIEDEIERILSELTILIGGSASEILEAYKAYGELDFILARGQLSISQKGREPQINEDGVINITNGRHPLLSAGEVVPLDIHLGERFDTLVITGPNTGGKTVSLKTVGLFAMLAQCGLHLPAGKGTVMPVFHSIWADIGDEQDIEQSLSTFSGHMKNIIEILHKASSPSLVLLDELGAGTDPSEGSALAMAILDELHQRGINTIATTHINELKVFAHLREGMENASMEFDPETLNPTYRLLLGVPGQSNALNVAERLGMPSDLIAGARSFMQRDSLNLEEAVSGLVKERRRLSQSSERTEEIKTELEQKMLEIEDTKKEMEQYKRNVLQKAKNKAESIVRTAKIRSEEIIKTLRQVEREKKSVSQASQEARAELKKLGDELELYEAVEERSHHRPLNKEEAREGQQVYVKSLQSTGEILRVQSEEEVLVGAGSIRFNTQLKDLEIIENGGSNRKTAETTMGNAGKKRELLWEKSASASPRADLRGLTLEEAINVTEKYFDDCILAGLKQVELIHGKGTGRLRWGIHEYLKDKTFVENFRLGNENEGGSGVTVVTLKDD